MQRNQWRIAKVLKTCQVSRSGIGSKIQHHSESSLVASSILATLRTKVKSRFTNKLMELRQNWIASGQPTMKKVKFRHSLIVQLLTNRGKAASIYSKELISTLFLLTKVMQGQGPLVRSNHRLKEVRLNIIVTGQGHQAWETLSKAIVLTTIWEIIRAPSKIKGTVRPAWLSVRVVWARVASDRERLALRAGLTRHSILNKGKKAGIITKVIKVVFCSRKWRLAEV